MTYPINNLLIKLKWRLKIKKLKINQDSIYMKQIIYNISLEKSLSKNFSCSLIYMNIKILKVKEFKIWFNTSYI